MHKQLEARFLSMQSADPILRILQENLKITDGRANFFDMTRTRKLLPINVQRFTDVGKMESQRGAWFSLFLLFFFRGGVLFERKRPVTFSASAQTSIISVPLPYWCLGFFKLMEIRHTFQTHVVEMREPII
jgi:hypothetical protein